MPSTNHYEGGPSPSPYPLPNMSSPSEFNGGMYISAVLFWLFPEPVNLSSKPGGFQLTFKELSAGKHVINPEVLVPLYLNTDVSSFSSQSSPGPPTIFF